MSEDRLRGQIDLSPDCLGIRGPEEPSDGIRPAQHDTVEGDHREAVVDHGGRLFLYLPAH